METKEHKNNGYEVERTHSGQKRRYGGTSDEYTVTSDKPEAEVLAYCTEHVHKCSLSKEEWSSVERSDKSSMDTHFRSHYSIRKKNNEGEYFYSVSFPSTH